MRRLRLPCFFRAVALALLLGGVRCDGFGASDGVTETVGEFVFEGERVKLVAEVEGGAEPFSFQWYKDGEPIPDAVGASLLIAFVEPGDAGAYAVLVSNAGGSTASLPMILAVTPAKRSRFANASVVASTGDGIVVGFALGGSGTSGATRVLARAAGPALAQFGVVAALEDPQLSIFTEGRLIASNDNWGGTELLAGTAAAVGAFPFPAAGKDAAVVMDLPRSSYSAQVSGAGGGTGVTMIELYDTSPGSAEATPRLVNISARGSVRSDGAKLTAGFTIKGGPPIRVLLRGVGPALAGFGVTDVLPDPRLSLFRESTLIATNENWADDSPEEVAAATTAVGAFALPENSLDSALLATLKPGSYTVQVVGARDAVGMALIEVYEVP